MRPARIYPRSATGPGRSDASSGRQRRVEQREAPPARSERRRARHRRCRCNRRVRPCQGHRALRRRVRRRRRGRPSRRARRPQIVDSALLHWVMSVLEVTVAGCADLMFVRVPWSRVRRSRGSGFPPEVIVLAVRWYRRFGLSIATSKSCWPSVGSRSTTFGSRGGNRCAEGRPRPELIDHGAGTAAVLGCSAAADARHARTRSISAVGRSIVDRELALEHESHGRRRP